MKTGVTTDHHNSTESSQALLQGFDVSAGGAENCRPSYDGLVPPVFDIY